MDNGENALPAQAACTEESDQDAPTQHDPDAQRREYASDASAELSPDAEQAIWVQGDMPSAPAGARHSGLSGADAQQMDDALLTVMETLTREAAERLGVSEQAPEADTSYQYYHAMLESRLSAMFECERLYVYWETPVDYQTIFKTSDEHGIILLAGGYDVAAKRLEDALIVDDGWVGRKNPGCVVKCVDAHVLGDGVRSTATAGAIYNALTERPGWASIGAIKSQTVLLISSELLDSRPGQLAAALYMAKVMYPDLFADLNPNEAWQLLRQEGTGTAVNGVYAYAPGRAL
ncbi:hypothetical protein LJC74_05295 [Eubacteriales bacterium OttesenSCG-928-A19]|nr:hypothetical protein [Eubacteriales bacterium OttesenSCG-928-A19]